MIWFACYKCGQAHSRPANSAGAMVFCRCGEGLTVPWESTMEPPPESSSQTTAPKLEPVSFPEERTPRPKEAKGRDTNFCFNHPKTPSTRECVDCGESFCPDCTIVFQGHVLCGPCKNFRLHDFHDRPRLSGLAVTSLIISLVTVPLPFCFLPLPLASGRSWLGLLPLLPQVLALLLGLAALRNIAKSNEVTGSSVALTGIAASLVFGVLTLTLALLTPELSQVHGLP